MKFNSKTCALVLLATLATAQAQSSNRDKVNYPGGEKALSESIASTTSYLNDLKQRQDTAENTAASITQRLRKETGRVDVSHPDLESYAARVEQQLDALQLERIGSQARIRALEDAVAEQSKRAEESSKADPVAEELQKVVKARKDQLAEIEKAREAAAITQSALQDAIATLAEAQAKVAERLQTVYSNSGGDTVAALKRELLTLSIGENERQSKIEYLQAQLARVTPALAESRDLDLMEQRLQKVQTSVEQTREQLQVLKGIYREAHPEQSTRPTTNPAQ